MMKAGILQLLTIGEGKRNGEKKIADCGLKDEDKTTNGKRQ